MKREIHLSSKMDVVLGYMAIVVLNSHLVMKLHLKGLHLKI
jgi:hypothetical protein